MRAVSAASGVANIAGGNLDRPDLPCFLIDPEMDLAPHAALRGTMFAAMPFAFSLDPDAGAIHEQVQRPLRTATGNGDSQGLPAAGRGC